MKTTIGYLAGILAIAGMSACNEDNTRSRFLDLNTGSSVELIEDEESGLLVEKESGRAVKIYVDRETRDTVWGATGTVINGMLYETREGDWKFKREEDEWKLKMADGEYKVKVDGDEYKEKWGDDYKVKRDDGEYKIKRGDYKKEVERDGDVTIKDGNKKIKIDGETGERKVKWDD